ncbi:hypothetical protein SAMN05444972_1072 [Marininema halotolerans]|uniref:Uncharacterized protein n=1 Tax=Marininema halotolerans TaxID=1155944 RepID=A0A1I6SDG1_9BACL|nr:hypothetical protein SAMN05444972_1072 [Marininema halotolerans]
MRECFFRLIVYLDLLINIVSYLGVAPWLLNIIQ